MTTYILDPVCIQVFGHNLTAMRRYGMFLNETKKGKIFLLVSKHLNREFFGAVCPDIKIDSFFSHYYPDFIPIEGERKFLDENKDSSSLIFDLAIQDFYKFINKYQPTENDTVFYPSIDYYSLYSLIRYVENNSSVCLPNFVIRFIGVMEYDHYKCGTSLEDLLKKLACLMQNKIVRVKISAESESMAKFIGKYIDYKIVITPTLVNNQMLEYPENDLFTMVFPGAGRRDKGFDRIESILDNFERISGSQSYRAIIQMLSPNELKYFSSSALNLVKNSRVVLLPCSLDDVEIVELFRLADLIVAPYDKNIYKYRSSAIMAESAIFGRPIVASDRCGFSVQVERYNLGLLAEDNQDFAKKIISFFLMSVDERRNYGRRARESFIEFSKCSYNDLFV
jgi:glycosyltransferase involved in cell wall biosynthesis